MQDAFAWTIFAVSLLILLSIVASKLSHRMGVPALLIFLVSGMLAGEDGLGGIAFKDYEIARSIGVVALAYILFAGGLESEWRSIRPIVLEGAMLSTLGTALTAAGLGLLAIYGFGFEPLQGMLLGAIVSSTDAASVFNVLRMSRSNLRGSLRETLEFESGSNDAMAVLLTIGLIASASQPEAGYGGLALYFLLQIGIGAAAGVALGWLIWQSMNRIRLEYDGLYIVFLTAAVPLVYALATILEGNGFLAVYIAGLFLGNRNFVHKRSNIRFMDGLIWLVQIVMFLTLGLLVTPSHMLNVALPATLLGLALIFLARPLAVFLSVPYSPRLDWKDRIFVSWVGLRGAAPIILATFPVAAGVSGAEAIFDTVFFIVLISLVLQGASIPVVARWLKLETPLRKKSFNPFEFENREAADTRLEEFMVPFVSPVIGKPIYELGMPEDSLITIIGRGEQYVVPTGQTPIEAGDVLLVLVNDNNFQEVADILSGAKARGEARARQKEPPGSQDDQPGEQSNL